MPLVLIAPTWEELIDAISVVVNASIEVVDKRLICKLVRLEIDIASAVSDFFRFRGWSLTVKTPRPERFHPAIYDGTRLSKVKVQHHARSDMEQLPRTSARMTLMRR